MRILVALILAFVFVGCSSDDPPKSPEAAVLTFPLQNSECTTGVDQSETTSRVEFRWQASENTETYELRVTHMITNVTQTKNTVGTTANMDIDKGAPYSWMVISRNSQSQESASSDTWQFYNAGSQTSYAPFPAPILAPGSGATVLIDSNGRVELAWSGADVDNDLNGYDIYHGTENPPSEIVGTTLVGTTTLSVDVDPGTYYWRVVSKDSQGNTSDSGTYSYRAL